jgi:hypothetical protein
VHPILDGLRLGHSLEENLRTGLSASRSSPAERRSCPYL